MDCYCDFEPATLYTATIRRARKPHQCSECGGLIAVGDRYEHVFGVWEGSPDTFKTCPRCLALREWVRAHVPCFCWSHQNIHDDAIETARAYAHHAPGLLFGAYRRLVAIRRSHRAAKNGRKSA